LFFIEVKAKGIINLCSSEGMTRAFAPEKILFGPSHDRFKFCASLKENR